MTSSMLVRLILIIDAIVLAPRIIGGRMKFFQDPTPETGSQCSVRQKSIWHMVPSQKAGIENSSMTMKVLP